MYFIWGTWHLSLAQVKILTFVRLIHYTVNPAKCIRISCRILRNGPRDNAEMYSTWEIYIWSSLILEFADRCYFYNSILDLLQCYLYIEIMKFLKLSCQGSNHHHSRNLCLVSNLNESPACLEPVTLWSLSSSLYLYTFILDSLNLTKKLWKNCFFLKKLNLHVFFTQINRNIKELVSSTLI